MPVLRLPLVMMKPPYIIPRMADVNAVPWNGFTAISTFSGCGGSSLGYRMAGFKMLWASEFIDEARATYHANKAPYTVVDGRDIRNVSADDILRACGLGVGELDLMDGSPPCASFSTSGSRANGWGQVKKYSDKEQRTDDLFFEYSRLIRGIMPKVFVAENVSGLVKGVAKGYFIRILNDLRSCGYDVRCQVLDAQWLGVPQARQRTIFIGVRNDLGIKPVFPKPLPYRHTVRDVLPSVTRIKVGGKPDNWLPSDRPAGTVVASDATTSPTAYLSSGGYIEVARAVHDTSGNRSHGDITDKPCPTVTCTPHLYVERAADLKEVDISEYAIGKEWDKLGSPGKKSTKYINLVRPHLDKPCNTITATGGIIGAASVTHPTERRKFTIAELKVICSFPADFVLTGNFSQQWERLGRAVPPLMMKAIAETVRDEVLGHVAR